MKNKKTPQAVPKAPGAVHMANVYRYFFLPVLVLVSLFWRSKTLLVMGLGFLTFAAYTFIGCKLRWKHLYLAFQEMQKQRMTPDKVDWNTIRLSTVLKFPMAFGILGAVMVIYQLFYL
ncbi:MAG: hypothetical protein ACI3V0_05280 [Faecousia sp.]